MDDFSFLIIGISAVFAVDVVLSVVRIVQLFNLLNAKHSKYYEKNGKPKILLFPYPNYPSKQEINQNYRSLFFVLQIVIGRVKPNLPDDNEVKKLASSIRITQLLGYALLIGFVLLSFKQ